MAPRSSGGNHLLNLVLDGDCRQHGNHSRRYQQDCGDSRGEPDFAHPLWVERSLIQLTRNEVRMVGSVLAASLLTWQT
jgi:hypothetical protein